MATSFMNYFKMGLGLGAGFQLSGIIFMFLGFVFFFPGYVLYKKEQKEGKRGSATGIFAVILMGLGVILMGGFGFSMLLDGINNMS